MQTFEDNNLQKLNIENELQASEHRFRSMIEHGHDVITLINADGNVIYRSPSYQYVLGYDPTQMQDQLVFDNIHPEDLESLRTLFGDLMMKPGATVKSQWRQKHSDGSYRWMEGTGTNLLTDPDIKAIVCNFKDITGHIETKQQLEKSNKELFKLFNSIDEVLYSADRNPYKLTQMSDACLKLYGYPAADFFENTRLWFDLILPEDRHVIDSMNTVLARGEVSTSQYRIRHKNGSTKWIEASVTPTLDESGVLVRVDGINRDITEKKTTQEAFLNNEKKFRTLIENSKDGIILTSDEARFIYVSPAVREILGYEPEELIGKYAYDVIHADFQESNLQGFFKEAGQPKTSVDIVLKVRHKNGTWRWIEASVSVRFDDPAVNAVVTNFRDITKRKETESSLLDSEKRFRALTENNKDGIGLTNREQRFIYLSPSVKNILGYEPEELIGTLAFERYHPDDQQAMQKLALSIREDRYAVANATVRILHKDNHWRWIELTSTNQLDDPAVNAIVTNFRDVTDKRTAEEALIHSEKKFRALIENNKEGIALSDQGRKFSYLSPAIKGILGYDPEELVGTLVTDLYHPDDRENMKRMSISLMTGQVKYIHASIRARHKNGRWRWLELTATNQLNDPAINAIVSNFRDISEEKKAAEALLNSEKRFRTLIENNKEGIALSDANRKFLYVTPSIKSILGYEPAEVIGVLATDLYHPDDRKSMSDMVKAIVEKKISYGTNLIRIRHKNGEWKWIELTATDQFNEPTINAMVTNFRDVTERKQAEEELEKLNESLEKKVAERTLELQESNKALESFSYMAAHDLQAPLRALAGYTALLKQDYHAAIGDDGSALLDTMVQQTSYMTQLIADLLMFSRASHTIIKEEQVDLDKMVSELSDQLCLTYSGRVTAEIMIDPLGCCSCDAGLIRQVWSNLISNALKYSSKRERPEIRIGSIRGDCETVFFVKDNGAGFDMRHATRLFQVFQRLHTVREFEGTGVGLALVKNVITRHGGRVWTESELDKGATFYFSVPKETILSPPVS